MTDFEKKNTKIQIFPMKSVYIHKKIRLLTQNWEWLKSN